MERRVRIEIDRTGLPELIPANVKHRAAEFHERIQPVSERISELGGEVVQRAFVHFNIVASLPADSISSSLAAISETEHVAKVWPAGPARP